MLWAQITLLVVHFLALLVAANQHGKPKTGKESFLVTASCIAVELLILFYAGAFSRVFHT